MTIGVILILAVAGIGACHGVFGKRGQIREIAAGKTLITAYQTHAAENDGRYLPGMDFTVNRISFPPYNRDITIMHAANRYPFRLAPYFEYALKGTVLLENNRKAIEKMSTPGTPMHDYVVSAFPTFGINYYFVGGCLTGSAASPSLVYPGECLSRAAQGGGSILVFASGGTTDGTIRMEGFNILTPPRLYAENWSGSTWVKKSDPGLYGNVDARHGGKAVCVFLDGSVKLLTIDELRDMRLWNKNAAEQNNPAYTISL